MGVAGWECLTQVFPQLYSEHALAHSWAVDKSF